MPLDNSAIDSVKDKKFTDFSNAVKQELKQKLSNHKVTTDYVSAYDKIKQMKDSFAKIAKTNDEPSEPSEPKIEEPPIDKEEPPIDKDVNPDDVDD